MKKETRNGESVKGIGPANYVWRDELIGIFSSYVN